MKPKTNLLSLLFAAGSSLLAVSSASAGQTWDGGSLTDSNWNTADNWDSNTLPNFANQIIFAGTTRATNVNNLTADTTIGGFNFTNSTTGQTFSISGNRITLGGTFTANQFTSVSNFPVANTDTIGFAMILNANRIFNIGQRRLSNFTQEISESGGARSLHKQGTGGIQLSAANTYSGTTRIDTGGRLLLNHSLGMQNSALDTTNTGTTTFVPKVAAFTLGGLIGNKDLSTIMTSQTGHSAGYSIVTALTLNPGTGASHSYSGVIANGAANMTLTKTGNGTQTLTNTNTYTGATNVNAGTLLVNSPGSLAAASAVTVGASGTLGGTGTINGLTTINGTHAPGASPGILIQAGGLTYNTGSNLTWELIANADVTRGTQYDGINVTGGALSIATGVTSNLVFNGVGSTVDWTNTFWDSNQSWLVYDNASLPTLSSGNIFDTINVTVDSLSQNFSLTGGTFSWRQDANDVYLDYTIPVIPEPTSFAMLAFGMISLSLFRKRS